MDLGCNNCCGSHCWLPELVLGALMIWVEILTPFELGGGMQVWWFDDRGDDMYIWFGNTAYHGLVSANK